MSNYIESGKKYARTYVSNKFKSSSATLISLAAMVALNGYVLLSGAPSILHVLTAVPLAGLGLSYWWHYMHKGPQYTEDAINEYQQWHHTQTQQSRQARLETINLEPYSLEGNDLVNEFKQSYSAFVNALKNQRIIQPKIKDTLHSKALDAYDTGVDLLHELKDVYISQDGSDLYELQQQLRLASSTEKAIIEQKIAAFNENHERIRYLTDSIKRINHSFDLSKMNIANITSKMASEQSTERDINELQTSIDAAKKVQQRLNRFKKGASASAYTSNIASSNNTSSNKKETFS